MATPFESLEKEVKKLRGEIRRLKGQDQDANQAAVNELISNGESNHERHTRGNDRQIEGGDLRVDRKNSVLAE